MRLPASLRHLMDEGIVQEVVRPLLSGKEADVYLVWAEGEEVVAKIYKEAHVRQFKHRAMYTEGRSVRGSREQRALANRSRYGKGRDELGWRHREVEMLYKLSAAGVSVPTPYHTVDNVVLMELITDEEGHPAPRIGDIDWHPEDAQLLVELIVRQVMKMLVVGVIHADLSPFNILWRAQGPVLIDFPQAVDVGHNNQARRLLLRDVDNIHRFASQHIPSYRRLPFAEEMWSLYETGALQSDTQLTGRYKPTPSIYRPEEVLDWIEQEAAEERDKQARKHGHHRSPVGQNQGQAAARSSNLSRANPQRGTPSRPSSHPKIRGQDRVNPKYSEQPGSQASAPNLPIAQGKNRLGGQTSLSHGGNRRAQGGTDGPAHRGAGGSSPAFHPRGEYQPKPVQPHPQPNAQGVGAVPRGNTPQGQGMGNQEPTGRRGPPTRGGRSKAWGNNKSPKR